MTPRTRPKPDYYLLAMLVVLDVIPEQLAETLVALYGATPDYDHVVPTGLDAAIQQVVQAIGEADEAGVYEDVEHRHHDHTPAPPMEQPPDWWLMAWAKWNALGSTVEPEEC